MGAGELARAPMKSCFSLVQVVFITKGGSVKNRDAPNISRHGSTRQETYKTRRRMSALGNGLQLHDDLVEADEVWLIKAAIIPKISAHGRRAHASEVPEGPFSRCFRCPANAGFRAFRGQTTCTSPTQKTDNAAPSSSFVFATFHFLISNSHNTSATNADNDFYVWRSTDIEQSIKIAMPFYQFHPIDFQNFSFFTFLKTAIFYHVPCRFATPDASRPLRKSGRLLEPPPRLLHSSEYGRAQNFTRRRAMFACPP